MNDNANSRQNPEPATTGGGGVASPQASAGDASQPPGRVASGLSTGHISSNGASLENPRPVSRGSKHRKPLSQPQNAGSESLVLDDSVALDWLSITAMEHGWLNEVAALLRSIEGGPGTDDKPFQGFKRCRTWPSGAQLLSGHRSGRGWLQLDGGACRNLGGRSVYQLGRVAMVGGRCKRIDIRRDQQGRGLTLIDDVLAACRAKQLCHVRKWDPMGSYDVDGAMLGQGVYLGSRSSTRFVRAYDKGLEQGGNRPGEWVRFEAQLRDDYAHEAAIAILGAEPDAWPLEAFKRLVGVIDFRVGRVSGRALSEFPRAEFWQRFMGGVESIRGSMEPDDVDAERWIQAIRDQYGGVMRLAAERAGVSVAELAARVFASARITDGTRKNPVVPKLAAYFHAETMEYCI